MFSSAASPTLLEILPVRRFEILPVLLYIIYAALVISSVNNGFFWDSILLASRYGQWYYYTNFSTLFVPEAIAGYPPLFGMLMAMAWKFFGKTLLVSHLVMLPFALGIVHQVLQLCRKFIPENLAPFAALLLLLDPTLMAQCTQVAPDVLLIFLYLFSLNRILQNRRGFLFLSLAVLAMLSPRGTIAVALLFVSDAAWFFFTEKEKRPGLLKLVLSYMPAALLVIWWQFGHLQHFGWIGYNPDSSWGAYSKFAGFGGMLRNTVIIGWRTVDFGRISLWFVFLFSVIYLFRNRQKIPPIALRLFTLFLIPFAGFSFIFLPFTNPIGHRYYLVSFLLFALFIFYLTTLIPNRLFRRSLYGFMLISLLSGHFWVYPETVAKGWDASLAHLPYFNLRLQAINYFKEENIPLKTVGSDYPNLSSLSVTDLLPDTQAFKPKNLETDKFIFYSNVFNGFTDEEIGELKTRWQPIKTWKSGQVFMTLYRKPE